MEDKVLKKIVIFITVFMIVFSNCGYTLEAIAATGENTWFQIPFFGKDDMKFKAYFLDENGEEKRSNVENVNKQMTIVLDFEKKAEGFLKSGIVSFADEEGGNTGFKIEDVIVDNDQLLESSVITASEDKTSTTSSDETVTTQGDTTLLNSEKVIDTTNQNLLDESIEESQLPEEQEENVGEADENLQENEQELETGDKENLVEPDDVLNLENEEITNTIVPEETKDVLPEVDETQEELVNEDEILEEENNKNNIISRAIAEASILSDNQIEISNIVENTKVYVNVIFEKDDNLKPEDLYKMIKVEFNGTFFKENLKEKEINSISELEIGWKYTSPIEVFSKYTKVSPFQIGEIKGTIVEDTITVRRVIEDENYLPLKSIKLEVKVPDLLGNAPVNLDVIALKLKASKGEDVNEVMFTRDNWEYNVENNTLIITVQNENFNFSCGEDVYVVTYRYEDYIETSEVELTTNGIVTAIEYSEKDNNEISETLYSEENVEISIGELITYSISTTEGKIGKGKINANYNQEIERYETEFDTTVSVNILTNDVLNEFTLKDTKEFYIDKEGLEFETNDVKYKKIKFIYLEIQEFLNRDGIIVIRNNNGEEIVTLNKENVQSQEDAIIYFDGDVRGVEIAFENIAVNGTISIEFTKAIGKSSYLKGEFFNFQKLESRINASVKYLDNEEEINLSEIRTEKEFEDSTTNAEISMNKVSLSTTDVNENVEFQISLNNERENSDLYINPVFEIVLPKYVTDIDIKSINMLYESGLAIRGSTVYRAEDQTQRMRIEVIGTQTEFSNGNATTIIVNTNITLDNYTPRKDEQVKLYYINEGATNYNSQTRWTLGIDVPAGILRTTNGFDSYVFKMDAPTGFITVNEMENYDGTGNKITSVKQGEERRKIPFNSVAQVARMNLIAINNTENECTDVVFLGRIPVKGITDIQTGEELETNIDTRLLSRIIEDEENPLSSEIFYSSNVNADKNFMDLENGWTRNPAELTDIKSFLIVPDNKVEPGYIFKYYYEFEIPENLPYEAKIYGTFGAFYNNHSELSITYESSKADLVGVYTPSGPELQVALSVDAGENNVVKSYKMLTYTATVYNSGGIDLNDITVTLPIPENTTYTKTDSSFGEIRRDIGDYGWIAEPIYATEELTYKIDELKAGEIWTKDYVVTACKAADRLASRGIQSDENGFYMIELDDNMEEVIKYLTKDEVKVLIVNQVKVNASQIAEEIYSNQVVNELEDSNFKTKTQIDINNETIRADLEVIHKFNIENISEDDYKNVVIEFNYGKFNRVNKVRIEDAITKEIADLSIEDIEINEKENKAYYKVGTLKAEESITLHVGTIGILIDEIQLSEDVYFTVSGANVKTEKGTVINEKYVRPKLVATDITSSFPSEVDEEANVTLSIEIKNIGTYTSERAALIINVSDRFSLDNINVYGKNKTVSQAMKGENVEVNLPVLDAQESMILNITLKAINISGSGRNTINFQGTLEVDSQEIQPVVDRNIVVINNVKTEDEKVEIKLEEARIESQKNAEKQQALESITSNTNNANTDKDKNKNTGSSTNNNSNINVDNNNNNMQSNNNASDSNKKEMKKYSISGYAWLDSNKNGAKDDNEKMLKDIKVELIKLSNKKVVSKTTTNSAGIYQFDNIEEDKYYISFEFDQDKYEPTIYHEEKTDASKQSDAILNSNNANIAVTNEINLTSNIQNVNIGLLEKVLFDLEVIKTLTTAKVTFNNGKRKEYDAKNTDIYKVEIKSRYLQGAEVELVYNISIKNVGSADGYAEQVVDYLPDGMKLAEASSNLWTVDANGRLFSQKLDNSIIKVGETRTLKLVLKKKMSSENTGLVTNKVELVDSYSKEKATSKERIDNNTSIQNTFISISTGGRTFSIIVFIGAILGGIMWYLIYTKKIKIPRITFKKIYK